jgi:dipeptidyl aminopeptidase/acylaminoacyl peptidase
MRIEQVSFYNRGSRLAGTLLLPDEDAAPRPGIVQGPGWLGLRDAQLYAPYHEALTDAGFVVMTLDYRGFADSEGDATFFDPMDQVADIRAALTFLSQRPEVDALRLGLFGSGGTGGGNAVMAAGLDSRVKATVSQVPVADGEEWLRRMRREYEWIDFRERVREASRAYAAGGEPELVSPREDIMVPSPERKLTAVKKDVDGRVPSKVALHAAENVFNYRPIDVVADIAPRALMLISVLNDAVTPEDHAQALYDAAGAPKRLLIQTGTTHYTAYAQYRDVVNPLIVEWFERYLDDGEIHLLEERDEVGISYLDRPGDPVA